MKTRQTPSGTRSGFGRRLIVVVWIPVLIAFWLFASVWLAPFEAPVRALNAPPTPDALAASSPAVNGTLASFTALFPQLEMIYLPTLAR